MQDTPTAGFARLYIERHKLAIVKLPPGKKYPTHEGWTAQGGYFTDADAATEFYRSNPKHGIGAVLGPSGLCSLDIDNYEESREVFAEFGIDIDALADSYPTIVGNPSRFRIEFRVPEGEVLNTHRLQWPDRDNPRKMHTVFELRSGDVQDVLPPTIHPDTGMPYSWRTRPVNGFQPLPANLLNIWKNWDIFAQNARDLHPDAPKPAPAPPKRQHTGASVIEQYNAANSIHDALERYGYRRIGKRYLSPHSKTGLPGCIMLDDNRVWIHHASDPLGGEHPVNAFDLFMYYDHGNDITKATRAAAKELGIEHKPAQRNAPAVQPQPQPDIDPETGEILTPNDEPYAAINAELPDLNSRRKPLSTIRNLAAVLKYSNITTRYNVIRKSIETNVPGKSYSQDNWQNASLSEIYSRCAEFSMPVGQIEMYLVNIADANLYNPVAEWILSRPWDGKSRLQSLYETIQSTNNALRDILIRRWMLSAVSAAFSPTGVDAHGILVLQGEQYLGKTRWLSRLCPPELKVFQEGAILLPSDKDSVMNCLKNWIVELGEVDATFRKADVAQLKAFITRNHDSLRKPFARAESEFARRTVFCASVNPRQYLSDPTGNRRYWTVECEQINHDHNIDIQQVWAELYMQYQAGEQWRLTAEEMDLLNGHNSDFEVVDPILERISAKLDWASGQGSWRWATATQILEECGFDRPTKSDATRAGQIILNRNGNKRRRSNGSRVLLAPPKKVYL